MSIDLSKLVAPLEKVKLPDGTEHEPVPMSGFIADLYRQIGEETNGDGKKDATIPWRVAQALLPTATEGQIKALNLTQCVAILAVAQGKVQMVLDAEKNGTGVDLLAMLLPADSSPMMPSAPSSSPSPAPPAATFTR